MRQYHKTSVGSKIFDLVNYVFVLLVALVCVYPFVYVFSVSVSNFWDVGYGFVKLFPIGFQLTAYQDVINRTLILAGLFNSTIYTVIYAILTVMLSAVGGFALAEKKTPFKKFFTFFLLVMMFFGGGMIPTYLLIRSLGLIDSMWAIVLPTAVVPFFIFLFRVFIKENVPEALKESVRLDGGNDWVVFFRIVLPLVKPIVATIGLFAAVSMWNSFVPALIYLTDRKKFPLTLLLRQMVVLGDFEGHIQTTLGRTAESEVGDSIVREVWVYGYLKSIKMAMTMITVLPILLVYPFAQRYFVRGILIGSLKD